MNDAKALELLLFRMLESVRAGMMPHLTDDEADILAPVLPAGWEKP